VAVTDENAGSGHGVPHLGGWWVVEFSIQKNDG